MKRYLKKISALVLTVIMVLSMCTVALAEQGKAPEPTDKTAVTIENMDQTATLCAYRIIEPTYGSGNKNLTGYKWTPQSGKTGTISSYEDAAAEITENYIKGLAANTKSLSPDSDFRKNGDLLPAGTWMIIATGGNANVVYNPMVVSVYYSLEGSGTSNSLVLATADAKTNWALNATNGYAKSTDIDVEKTVAEGDVNSEVGTEVTFTITGHIPSYVGAYETVKYDITDTIKNGLEYVENSMTFTTPDGVGNPTVTGFTKDSTSFKASFASADILSVANLSYDEREVTITYKAKVTEAAITKPGENEAKVEYTRSNSEDTGSTTKTEYTNTVNFSGVLKKVGTGDDEEGLAGATFTLYTDENLTKIFGTCETSVDNYGINFKGLDADKTYYLKETAAKNGYTVNNTVYTITFTNVQYDTDGKITSYKIHVNYMDGNNEAQEKVIDINGYDSSAADFADTVVNTKLSSLPSTGGIGTYLFTIVGVVIMAAAAGLFFVKRRRDVE